MVLKAGAALLLACACLFSEAVRAASDSTQRTELTELRSKIRAIQDGISRGEENHDEVSDELAGADKAIAQVQRRLRDINRQRQETETVLRDLRIRQSEVEIRLASHRRQLGDAVYRLYVEGGRAGTRRFLSGDDPSQLARESYYLQLIAKQRIATIEEARVGLRELQHLADVASTRDRELVALEAEQRREQEKLQRERGKQKEVLAQLSDQLREQRRQMVALQRDESRLEKLVKGLERLARASAQAAAEKKSPRQPRVGQSVPIAAVSPVIGERVDQVPTDDVSTSSFASKKGRLHWPVRGELVGRFGGHRTEGGTLWRGVFIRTDAGVEVKAIAGGTIAYADWLRGFGNLVIVDHGGGYMSVYGNNESVFKNPGETVRAGETIASVGASGGADESGLYFEIRFQGQPQDPGKWVAAK